MTNEEYRAQSEKFNRIVRAIRASDPWLATDLGKFYQDEAEAADRSGGRFRVGTFQSWVCENYDNWDFEPSQEDIENDRDDDFPLSLEYDEGEGDMYADGDGFYTNDPGDW